MSATAAGRPQFRPPRGISLYPIVFVRSTTTEKIHVSCRLAPPPHMCRLIRFQRQYIAQHHAFDEHGVLLPVGARNSLDPNSLKNASRPLRTSSSCGAGVRHLGNIREDIQLVLKRGEDCGAAPRLQLLLRA